MSDLIFVVVMIAFFALAALFVKGCDIIIGPDEEALAQRPDGGLEPTASNQGAGA